MGSLRSMGKYHQLVNTSLEDGCKSNPSTPPTPIFSWENVQKIKLWHVLVGIALCIYVLVCFVIFVSFLIVIFSLIPFYSVQYSNYNHRMDWNEIHCEVTRIEEQTYTVRTRNMIYEISPDDFYTFGLQLPVYSPLSNQKCLINDDQEEAIFQEWNEIGREHYWNVCMGLVGYVGCCIFLWCCVSLLCYCGAGWVSCETATKQSETLAKSQ